MDPEKSGGLPLVSICIPTYNRAGMVGDAIRSALAQGYPALEVVVVDNASTDTTALVVASFSDPRLRFVRNDRNLGLFGNFNRCIELARGSFIHILHSDDTIPPGFTEACMAFVAAHPEVAMTFTPAQIEGAGGVQAGGLREDRIFPAPSGFSAILRDRGLVFCPSVMVRKEVYGEAGPFSLEFPYSSDLYEWLTIARRHAIANVAGTHVTYRQGAHSESHRLLFESPLGYVDMVKIFARVIRDLGEERDRFTPDLNAAITRFVGDCLYALFTRGGQMEGFSPGFLAGVARAGWSHLRPLSFRDRLKKAGLLLAIIASPVLCRIPGAGRAILALKGREEISY